ncbi:MAG: helix-turn-helix domain-containing protein [Chloroflexi bacterium]|nr:helix-turn-helix domain-containing protein [Chloroflexota bacterium]
MSKPLALELGIRLRALRQSRRLTAAALAGDALSPATISRIEHGTLLPSLGALQFLAERLGVPLAVLLPLTEEGVEEQAQRVVEAWLLLEQPLRALEYGRAALQRWREREPAVAARPLEWALARAEAWLDESCRPGLLELLKEAQRSGAVIEAARLALAAAPCLDADERVGMLQQALHSLAGRDCTTLEGQLVRVELLTELARQHWRLGQHETARGLLVQVHEQAEALTLIRLARQLLGAEGRRSGDAAPAFLVLAVAVRGEHLLGESLGLLARLEMGHGRTIAVARRLRRILAELDAATGLKEVWESWVQVGQWRVQGEEGGGYRGEDLANHPLVGRFELALTAGRFEEAEHWAALLEASSSAWGHEAWKRVALAWAEAGNAGRAAQALQHLCQERRMR